MVLFGPDVSHNNGLIDMAAVKAAGCGFAFCKVTEGSTFRDPAWPHHRDGAKAAGLLLAGYHYVRTDDPDKQAAACKAWLGDTSIPVALDWEKNGGNGANLLAVLAAFQRAGLNVRLIYTGAWYWQPNGAPDLSGTGCALWKSRYPTTDPGTPAALYAKVPASYWAGLGGLDTTLLQFTDHAQIAGASLDCSAFNGTRDQLAALLGATPPAQEDDMASVSQESWDTLQTVVLDIWSQLAGAGAEPGQFTGWPSDEGGSGNSLTLVDYVRQADVQLNGLKSAGATGGLSDADKEDIAQRVAELLAARLAQ